MNTHSADNGTAIFTTISARALSKVFVTEQGNELWVFKSMDVAVQEREFVSIIGPSGCGKTTLLKVLAGLEEPSGGTVEIDGVASNKPSREKGFVFQEDCIFPWRTVVQNIRYGPEKARCPKVRIEQVTEHLLKMVGLQRFRDYYPKELSGGMRKRVAIAMVYANNPRILLMDEPFGSLDYVTKSELQDELLRIWEEEKKTVVFVTHDLEEAIYLADRVLVMKDGSIAGSFSVPLKRPREMSMKTGVALQSLKEDLWMLITK